MLPYTELADTSVFARVMVVPSIPSAKIPKADPRVLVLVSRSSMGILSCSQL